MRLRSVLALVAAAALIGAGVAAGEMPLDRRAELKHLLQQDCGSCHGLTMKGGLGSPLLPAALGGRSDEALIEAILNGVPGTPMPPWRYELTREDAAALVDLLRRGDWR